MLRLRNYGKFISLNILIAALIAVRYFQFLPELPSTGLEWLFILTSTFSHMAVLGAVLALLVLPLVALPALARKILVSAAATAAIGLLVVDTNVFAQYRFHINAVVMEMFWAGQVIEFPLSMWLTAGAGLALLWLAEYALLAWLASAHHHALVWAGSAAVLAGVPCHPRLGRGPCLPAHHPNPALSAAVLPGHLQQHHAQIWLDR